MGKAPFRTPQHTIRGMFAGVILAAGRSSRMGQPKALLPQTLSGDNFVSHLTRLSVAAGLTPVLVVGRAGDSELLSVVERAGANFIVNSNPELGQLSSILAGLETADAAGASAIVVMPVDVPLISTAVVSALVKAAEASAAQIVRASHHGVHGHPVLFKRAVFDELRRADPAIGARAVVRADPARVVDVEVGEAGVTVDIDTPADYLRAFGREL